MGNFRDGFVGVVGLRNGFSKILGMGVVGCSNQVEFEQEKMEGTMMEGTTISGCGGMLILVWALLDEDGGDF